MVPLSDCSGTGIPTALNTLPHARFELIDGAGHVPTMTRPDVVARAMLAFIPPVGKTMG